MALIRLSLSFPRNPLVLVELAIVLAVAVVVVLIFAKLMTSGEKKLF